MFSKGQKVVCVNGDFPPAAVTLYVNFPEKNKVYTVRASFVGRTNYGNTGAASMDADIGILLEEIHNPRDPRLIKGLDGELGFSCDRFRPLQELPPKKETLIREMPDEGESYEEFERRKYGSPKEEIYTPLT